MNFVSVKMANDEPVELMVEGVAIELDTRLTFENFFPDIIWRPTWIWGDQARLRPA